MSSSISIKQTDWIRYAQPVFCLFHTFSLWHNVESIINRDRNTVSIKKQTEYSFSLFPGCSMACQVFPSSHESVQYSRFSTGCIKHYRMCCSNWTYTSGMWGFHFTVRHWYHVHWYRDRLYKKFKGDVYNANQAAGEDFASMAKYVLCLEDNEELRSKFTDPNIVSSVVANSVYQSIVLGGTFTLAYIVLFFIILILIILVDVIKTKFNKLCKTYNARQSGEVCAICYYGKGTQYFQPCGHLVCCAACSNQMLECPMCKEFIKEELTTPVISRTPNNTPAAPAVVPCKACGAENRAQSQRILVPCGHVVSCEDGCARYLEDCPQCWEVVTDDKKVFLP